MDWKQIKQYYIFGLALLVSAFLIWFGSKFLFTSGAIEHARLEKLSWVDSIYFCVITLATVGYGDITPKTDIG